MDEGVSRLYKPGTRRPIVATTVMPPLLQPNLVAAVNGLDVMQDGYDSDDDPASLLGLQIQVRWYRGQWWPGVVTG